MGADVLLSRLDRVRKTGPGRWVACCPAHESKSKSSLNVTELPDGRVLVIDRGQCATEDVLRAVGLDYSVLFPERIDTSREALGGRRYRSRAHRPFDPMQVLMGLVDDALLAATIVSRAMQGNATEDDAAALYAVAGRLSDALEACNGR
jgi:hypothetical protein